jgi:hypothetical protein
MPKIRDDNIRRDNLIAQFGYAFDVVDFLAQQSDRHGSPSPRESASMALAYPH